MDRLLGGSPKEVVMLTATPINNGLWDLYSLVMLFARHDRAFASHGIDSVSELFLRAGASERDPENLNPDVLFPLADAVSVRRDRAFIEIRVRGAAVPRRHARALSAPKADDPPLRSRRLPPGAARQDRERDRRAHDGALPSERLRTGGRRARSGGAARRSAALRCAQALRVVLVGVSGDGAAHALRPRCLPCRLGARRGSLARDAARSRPYGHRRQRPGSLAR